MPHVLATLDRTHDPARVPEAVRWAREAGFEQVSVDLIYGTPGESIDDWAASVDQAIALEPDHVSAYALIVEQGTAFARRVARGEVVMPGRRRDGRQVPDGRRHPDVRRPRLVRAVQLGPRRRGAVPAQRPLLAQRRLAGASDPARTHTSSGERWWNVKHPAAYAQRLAAGESPMHDHEVLDPATSALERMMLETRLREGLPLGILERGRGAVPSLTDRGLVEVKGDHLVLTRDGRLLADAVVRDLTP